MENFSVELFSRLFFLNLAKNFITDKKYSFLSDQVSPSESSNAALEPPTPPRTPVINSQSLLKSIEKNHDNNNDGAEENLEGNASSFHGISDESDRRVRGGSREYVEYPQPQFNDESNVSDEEHGGRDSFISEALRMNENGEESDHEESDCASFDSSKLSLKNIEKFLDKSPMVSLYNFCASTS